MKLLLVLLLICIVSAAIIWGIGIASMSGNDHESTNPKYWKE